MNMFTLTCAVHVRRCIEADEQLYFRIRLDRRRFEVAHLKYALLKTQKRYATINHPRNPDSNANGSQ